jgi:hypothetical protein
MDYKDCIAIGVFAVWAAGLFFLTRAAILDTNKAKRDFDGRLEFSKPD